MSSFVSCSVNGLSPSCDEKTGANPVSFKTPCMISVYLLFSIVGWLVGNKDDLYSSQDENFDQKDCATSTFLDALLPSHRMPLLDQACVRSACLKTFSFGIEYFWQSSLINVSTVALCASVKPPSLKGPMISMPMEYLLRFVFHFHALSPACHRMSLSSPIL